MPVWKDRKSYLFVVQSIFPYKANLNHFIYNDFMTREEFEKILSSIIIPPEVSGEELQKLLLPMNYALLEMMPERLYRYRTCNELNIEAFRDDQVWMVTADKYNDPFDTLIGYDSKYIMESIDQFFKPGVLKTMTEYIENGGMLPAEIQSMFDKETIREFIDLARDDDKFAIAEQNLTGAKGAVQSLFAMMLPLAQQSIQRLSTIACFSEIPDSILMWSHYADYHTGFVLGYDMRPMLLPNSDGLGLYPVVYDSSRYDASQFLLYYLAGALQLPAKNPDQMSLIKQMLYKSQEWSYEREWRLIDANPDHERAEGFRRATIIKPNSIYYGSRISEDKKHRLQEIALSKGLEQYRVYVNNASHEYRMIVERVE